MGPHSFPLSTPITLNQSTNQVDEIVILSPINHRNKLLRCSLATEAPLLVGTLAYINSVSFVPIYHRDIKSLNLLLDEKYVVKLADFGISRSIEVDQIHLTTMVKGTFGYLDLEYFHSHQYSEKSKVYSFVVVLAELLSETWSASFISETSAYRHTSFHETCLAGLKFTCSLIPFRHFIEQWSGQI